MSSQPNFKDQSDLNLISQSKVKLTDLLSRINKKKKLKEIEISL